MEGGEFRLNSEYSKNSWGFIVNKQSGRVNGWKITKKRQRLGGFLLNWPNKILAKGRLFTSKVEDEELE